MLFPDATKPNAVVPVSWRIPVAIRRTHAPRVIVPGTAAQRSGVTRSRTGWVGYRRRRVVLLVVAIPHPLVHAAQHVVEFPGVRILARHLPQRPFHRDLLQTRIPGTGSSGARRILPLSFVRQN